MGASNGIPKRSVNLKKSIKSFYITKDIFSFLSEKKKLDMIRYNKRFQNKFGIDLEYFKKISGKYITWGTHVYTLDNNIKIFEGQYYKGKKTGLGKEYYLNGKLKFEGVVKG